MAGPGQGEVWLYKDGKYVGTTWKYDESKPNFEDLGCDEKVSSLRVGPGVTVILFDKKNYGGSSIEYNADAPTLGRFNDKSRSMKLLKEYVFAPDHIRLDIHCSPGLLSLSLRALARSLSIAIPTLAGMSGASATLSPISPRSVLARPSPLSALAPAPRL